MGGKGASSEDWGGGKGQRWGRRGGGGETGEEKEDGSEWGYRRWRKGRGGERGIDDVTMSLRNLGGHYEDGIPLDGGIFLSED